MAATCGSIEIAMHFCMFQVAMQSFSASMLSNGFEIAIKFICICSNINGSSNDGDSGDVALRLRYNSACSMRRGGNHGHASSGIKFLQSLWLFWLPVLEFQSVKFLLYLRLKQHCCNECWQVLKDSRPKKTKMFWPELKNSWREDSLLVLKCQNITLYKTSWNR